MAPFWFRNPALYWNYNETLQCICIKKPPRGICQPNYQGEIMARDVHLTIPVHLQCTGAMGQYQDLIADLSLFVWSVRDLLSTAPAMDAQPQKTWLNSLQWEPPLQFPSAFSEACRARELPPDGLPACLWNRGVISLPAV